MTFLARLTKTATDHDERNLLLVGEQDDVGDEDEQLPPP